MAKEYAKSFYESLSWKKCRKGFMQSKHYICERCGGSAYIAHHKVHITPGNINNLNIILNWDNLQALCLDCHNVVHGNSSTVNGVSFDNEGNLIYSPQVEKK